MIIIRKKLTKYNNLMVKYLGDYHEYFFGQVNSRTNPGIFVNVNILKIAETHKVFVRWSDLSYIELRTIEYSEIFNANVIHCGTLDHWIAGKNDKFTFRFDMKTATIELEDWELASK